MTLPILLSVPHAGLRVPHEANPYCRLTLDDIVKDSDEGAADIYALGEHVQQFVTTDIARAIVDLNRHENDFSRDGVIKTHTCWNVPVYGRFPPASVISALLEQYYRPYHEQLAAPSSTVKLCVDCHTMAAVAPPVAPDAGCRRPHVCLGDAQGTTLPEGWMFRLAACFTEAFGAQVAVNSPFSGGHITRYHGAKRPWVQLELSRASFLPNAEKRSRVLSALQAFCEQVLA